LTIKSTSNTKCQNDSLALASVPAAYPFSRNSFRKTLSEELAACRKLHYL